MAVLTLASCAMHSSHPSAVAAPAGTRLSGFPSYAATVVVPMIDVHAQPADTSPVVARFGRFNENGAPQTFLVKSTETSTDAWYDVLLPVRPNGSSGWVRASDVDVAGVRAALAIHLRSFRLDLYADGHLARVIPIGVGAQNTPTPSGEYYIKELIRPPDPNTVYGHYVLGLSGFSNVLLDWPDGGVIGIHGTNDPSSIGRRVSHGCIRMSNENIEYLARLLPLGTPVRIEAN